MIQIIAPPEPEEVQEDGFLPDTQSAASYHQRMQLVSWPTGGRGEFRPSQRGAMERWHRVRCWGRWNADAMVAELAPFLIHSDISTSQGFRKAKRNVITLLFALADGSLVCADYTGDNATVSIWAETPQQAKDCFDSLAARFLRRKRRAREVEFFVLVATQTGIERRKIAFRGRRYDSDSLSLHYGSGFAQWDHQLQSVLKTRESGLTILRGEPGTGKTSYLRYLMWRLRRSHAFYYLPISAFALIAAPAAVDFWIQQKIASPTRRKVVLIEDAESLLMSRAADNRESVSNLLNTSDGFMAEYLNLHVICTINCPLSSLDPALTRAGRLVAGREFGRLSRRKAERLAAAKNLKLEDRDTYSLAEIYNSSISTTDAAAKRIGFHAGAPVAEPALAS